MSLDLLDCRTKISAEADCVIEALSRSQGRDKSEIVREWIHAEVARRLSEARMMDSLLRAKGERGIAEGSSGNLRESQA